MTDPDHLAAAFGDRFVLERELARDRTGITHVATDARDGGRVFVHVMDRDLVSSIGADRVRSELEAAAALTHPSILAIREWQLAADGTLVVVMAHVEGETLRARLANGPVPIAEATRIAVGVAGALDHAHRRGLVHGGITSDRILVTGRNAVLTGFGVARVVATRADTQDDIAQLAAVLHGMGVFPLGQAERFRSAGDFAAALATPAVGQMSILDTGPAAPRFRRAFIAIMVILVLAAVVLASARAFRATRGLP